MIEKEQRLDIWRALSDLFLDTEVDELTFKHIAQTIQRSSYSVADVERILWNEVYPVLNVNLRSMAGEWAGWSDAWLLESITVSEKPRVSRFRYSFFRAEIKQCWSKINEQLPVN